MERNEFINLSLENIGSEHICCALSDKKCTQGYLGKKRWLAARIKDGYVFKKLDVRGKVFIEYVPADKAWAPVDASGYMFIHCFWVSGQFKDKGFGRELLQACEQDAAGMNGLVVIAGNQKRPFLSDKKYFIKRGFTVCDTAEPYFELLYKPFCKAPIPKFRDIARQGRCDVPEGLSVYYSPACPFNEYYVHVELAKAVKTRAIPLVINKLESLEQARNHFVPHSIYSLFYNGKFVTQQIIYEKNFNNFIDSSIIGQQ